jgi:hypothetical protein
LGCWISPRYCPFSLGVRYETLEPYIYLIFHFFLDRGKPWITETVDTGSVDTEARLYFETQEIKLFTSPQFIPSVSFTHQ